jgi:hypothetical protein
MPDFETVRTVAMSLPGAYERTSYTMPAFYVGKKLFARLREDGCSLVVNAADLDRFALSQMDPGVFSIPEHYQKYEMMVIDLPNVQLEELERLLIESWRRVAPKKLLDGLNAGQTVRDSAVFAPYQKGEKDGRQ